MHPDPVSPDLIWLKGEYERLKCPSGTHVDRRHVPEPLNVILKSNPAHRVSGLVSRTGIAIYHRNLVQAIRPYLDGFVLGACRLSTGEILSDYLTCYAKTFFIPRGDRKANYYTCGVCGRVALDTSGQRDEFALRKDLSNAMVFHDGSTRLYLHHDLASQIDWTQWPDASIEEVRVIEWPHDSHRLPGDPDWEAVKQQARTLTGPPVINMQPNSCYGEGKMDPGLMRSTVTNATLPDQFLTAMRVVHSELRNVSLTNCGLCLAKFNWTTCTDCDFSKCDLTYADLRASTFIRCKFVDADLFRSDLRGSQFESCDFTNAKLNAAELNPNQRDSIKMSDEQRDSIIWSEEYQEPEGG